MSLWSDLVAAGLLGLSRAALPALTSGTALDALLGQLEQEPSVRRAVKAAALLSVWEQAGALPLATPAPLPAPAPPDERRPCPSRVAAYLAEILQGGMGAALPEWLQLQATAGCSLPHRWLPELLDLAGQRRDLRPQILPHLDNRGRWLAGQHPDWQKLLVAVEPAAWPAQWETGTRETRRALLQEARASEPDRARELLASTWAEDAPAERAEFLSVLATGLGPADEPFLEAALDDRRKEVRAAAADLLARLPSSRLVARMQTRLQPLLLGVPCGGPGRGQLRLELPTSCDPAMVRDGVEKKPPAGLGERAWWLLQLLAAVPPATWSREWSLAPAEIVRLASRAEYEAVLLEGWSHATARTGDATWAEALLHRWEDRPWQVSPRQPLYFQDDLGPLILAVPQERIESWLIDLLGRRSLEQDSALLSLLQQYRRPWGQALTRAVLDSLRPLASKPLVAVGYWRAALVDFAYYAAPALADEAALGWPAESTWKEQLDRFLAILHFRQEMLESWARAGSDHTTKARGRHEIGV